MDDPVEDQDFVPGASPAAIAVDHDSVLDRIKQRRDEQDEFLTIDIPSWDGDLKARYKVLDRDYVEKTIRRIRARANGASTSGVESEADFLIEACVEVVGYDAENDATFHVSDGYTMDLARSLDPKYPKGHSSEGEPIRIDNPRELVVYMLKWNGIALAAHAQTVARWMQNLKKPIEDPQ
jgi:hypothetical protein